MGEQAYYGRYEENLEDAVDVYNETEIMCEVTDTQKRNEITKALKGPARPFSARNSKNLGTHEEATQLLPGRYNRQ